MACSKMISSFVFFLCVFISAEALEISSVKNNHSSISNESVSLLANGNGSNKFYSTLNQTMKQAEARGLKYLTPGQEFLLSVASYEDTKGPNWEGLPYLMKVMQQGRLDIKNGGNIKKSDKSTATAFPMRMFDMIKVMTATEKADGDDDTDNGSADATKSQSYLAKLAQDPMNILLVALIPISILLAAVIPLLVNQLMSGSFIPPVTTVAAGDSESRQQRQFFENLVPILEGIASFGSRMSEEMTKEKTEKKKFSILKSILQLVTSFINEKWLRKFGSTNVQRLRSCKGKSC